MGRFNFNFINSPDRLKEAAVQNDNRELVGCSTEVALKAAASALAKVRDTHGGSAVAVLCGGMLTNEEYYMAQKLARGALASNHVDTVSGPWQLAIHEALNGSLGFGAMTNSFGDIENAQAILVLGSNTIEKHAMAGIRARKAARQGAVLIVAHPSQVLLTKTARMHLQLNEGTEAALIQGLIKTVIDEALHDKAFVDQYTQDFAKLERSVQKVNMADIAQTTGLSEDAIREAARLFASQRPGCLVYGVDPRTSPTNDSFFRNCAALQLLLGSVGVPGGGLSVMGFGGNGQGAADFGALPKYLPGYKPVTSSPARKGVAKIWGASPPEKAGLNASQIFEAIEKGEIKALYLIGCNPFDLGLPRKKIETALARLDTLVYQDCIKTDVCELAQVVLPSVSFVEKSGTATNCERRVQKLTRSLDGTGNGTSDFELFNGLLAHLNPGLQLDSWEAAFAESTQLMAEMSGISVEGIPVEGIQWPLSPSNGGTERVPLPTGEKDRFKFFGVK
jgi:formate dehydrogenase alpha subunit